MTEITKLTEYTSRINHGSTAIVINVVGDTVFYVTMFSGVVGTTHVRTADSFRGMYYVG